MNQKPVFCPPFSSSVQREFDATWRRDVRGVFAEGPRPPSAYTQLITASVGLNIVLRWKAALFGALARVATGTNRSRSSITAANVERSRFSVMLLSLEENQRGRTEVVLLWCAAESTIAQLA